VPFLLRGDIAAGKRAAGFHCALANAIVDLALRLAEQHRIERIGLTGGVFQNRLLSEEATAVLAPHGFDVRLSERLPCNDAGIAFGQVVHYAASR
jgi:hydrogenase maturation protein HypF